MMIQIMCCSIDGREKQFLCKVGDLHLEQVLLDHKSRHIGFHIPQPNLLILGHLLCKLVWLGPSKSSKAWLTFHPGWNALNKYFDKNKNTLNYLSVFFCCQSYKKITIFLQMLQKGFFVANRLGKIR